MIGGEKMKKRKNMYILAIVALILVLGVGYAVVSSVTLTINGTAAAATNDLKVVYDGVNTNSGVKVTAQTADNNSKEATFTVEGMVLGTEEYATFEIKNKETDVNASIAIPTVTVSNSDYFDAKVYYDDSLWSSAKTLNAQGTAVVKVVVSLKNTPVTEAQSSTNITVSFVASPVTGS